jgi:GrpB-like predicted nucleotidyltransferase (UPF0157 family)
MPDPIEIVAYNREWVDEFWALAARLREGLGDIALRIDHIGSTAVPGLPAKDVIDIQVTVASLEPIKPIREGLERAGFVLHPTIGDDHRPPGEEGPAEDWLKRYAREGPGKKRTHVHIRQQGRRNQRYALLFRDYLRSHPHMAEAYARLKFQIAAFHRDDRDAYVEIKDPAVDLIALPAEEWAERTGWQPGPSDA